VVGAVSPDNKSTWACHGSAATNANKDVVNDERQSEAV